MFELLCAMISTLIYYMMRGLSEDYFCQISRLTSNESESFQISDDPRHILVYIIHVAVCGTTEDLYGSIC